MQIDEALEFSVEVIDASLTCGWLLSETTRRYSSYVQCVNNTQPQKVKKRLIIALKTLDQNEGLDFWLIQLSRSLEPLPSGLVLRVHFSSTPCEC